MKTTWARHFSSPHPLWRAKATKTGIWWEESAYYFWWLFLRENEGYRKACKKGGGGKFAKLYADFGDVFATDFKTWFTRNNRGQHLFAEPAVPSIVPLTRADLAQLPDQFEESLILLAIDRSLPIRSVMNKVRAAFKRSGLGRKRGQRTLGQSRALYPLVTTLRTDTLKKTYDLYRFYKEHPETKLWELGNRFRVSGSFSPEELIEARKRRRLYDDKSKAFRSLENQKNLMTVGARRHLANAKSIIEWAGKGKFPVFTTTKVKS